MFQQGYLTDQVHDRIAVVYTASAGTELNSPIYDLTELGAHGLCFEGALATIHAGNFFQLLASNTAPSDGSKANGQWTGATKLATTVAGSKVQGAANGDLLRLDAKNLGFRYAQLSIIRAGANTVSEQARVSFYNNDKTPQTSWSTTITKQLNVPALGTP